MMSRSHAVAALALAAVLASLSCNSATAPSKNMIESFTGVIPPGSGGFNVFRSNNRGEYNIRLKSLEPPTNAVVGVTVGPGDASGCSFTDQGLLAVGTSYGNQILKGSYCVGIFDVIGLAQEETYTIEVSHP